MSTGGGGRETLPGWHHVPEVPIAVSPFFSWPPEPRRMVSWIAARWFAVAENLMLVGIALVVWAFFQPSLEATKTLSWTGSPGSGCGTWC